MRLHPVLALVVLLGLGTVASVAGAALFAAAPMAGAKTAGALQAPPEQDPPEQDTTAEALTSPSSDEAEGREFATKLLAARQENAQRQYEGQPSVWMSMSVDLRDIPAQSAKPEIRKTRSLSGP